MAKDQLCIKIYTYKNISDIETAKEIIAACSGAGLHWEKIGDKEPLREIYSDELFLQLWRAKKETGLNKDSLIEYANVFCSQSRGKVLLTAGWKNSDPAQYSSVELFMSYKDFSGSKDRYFDLLKQLIGVLDADYACICNWNFWRNIRGTYFRKIPIFQDVHWVTFFSHNRMQEMKGSIKELEWNASMALTQGIVCLICENIPKDGDLIETRCLEYRSCLWNI